MLKREFYKVHQTTIVEGNKVKNMSLNNVKSCPNVKKQKNNVKTVKLLLTVENTYVCLIFT